MNQSEIISQYVRMNRKFEVAFMPKVKRAIHVKVKDVIDDLNSGGYDKAIAGLSADIGNETMSMTIRNLYRVVGTAHARVSYSRLLQDQKKGFGFNQEWTDWILNYLKQFLFDKITFRIAETTREALMKALTIGVTSGLGIDGMIKQLEEWPFERYQAARIVRTEVNRAANVGALAQAQTGEYEQQKEWISVQDFRTRGHNPKDHANHVALNGTKVDADADFIDQRNGDRLQFPGDPNGKAESTINCRCQAVFVNKRDANGNLIPKVKPNVFVIGPKEEEPEIEYKTEPEMRTEKMMNTMSAFIEALTEPYEEKVQTILQKVNESSTDVMESFTDLSTEVKGQTLESSNKFEEVFNRIIKEVKGIKPDVKVDVNQGPVIAAIETMGGNLSKALTDGLNELKDELKKKKTVVHTITRDDKDLIKTITTVTQ